MIIELSLYPLPDDTQFSVQLISLPTPEVQHQPEMEYHVMVTTPPRLKGTRHLNRLVQGCFFPLQNATLTIPPVDPRHAQIAHFCRAKVGPTDNPSFWPVEATFGSPVVERWPDSGKTLGGWQDGRISRWPDVGLMSSG